MTSLLLGGIQHPHYGITHHPKNWFKCHSIVHYKRGGDPSASASIGPQLPSLGRQDWKQATVQTDSYLSNPLVAMGNEVALSLNFPNVTFSNFYPFPDLSATATHRLMWQTGEAGPGRGRNTDWCLANRERLDFWLNVLGAFLSPHTNFDFA